MSTFGAIFMHYTQRPFKNMINYLILLGIPLGIIILNLAAATGNLPEYVNIGEIPTFVFIVVMMTLCFQFFSGEFLHEFLNYDLRSELKWRLLASPVARSTYVFAMAGAGFVTTIMQGLLIFVVMIFGFGVKLGSPLIWLPVLVVIAIMSQLVSVLVVLFTTTKKATAAMSMTIGFAIMATGGVLFIPPTVIPDFMFYSNPAVIGARAMMHQVDHTMLGGANPWLNIAILAGITLSWPCLL